MALTKAATDHRATLTPHNVAISRADKASRRIEQYMASLRGTGVLKEFNRAYKQHRTAATARGQGFMTYKVAEARLRRGPGPLLCRRAPHWARPHPSSARFSLLLNSPTPA